MNGDERRSKGLSRPIWATYRPRPTPWSDAERDTVVRLAEGDSAAFLARAREDPGFPFEPAAITALVRFAKDRRAGLAKAARTIEG